MAAINNRILISPRCAIRACVVFLINSLSLATARENLEEEETLGKVERIKESTSETLRRVELF